MNEGIGWGPVSRVFQTHAGFEFIEQGFDDESFAQHDLVEERQQIVFHVAANAGDQMQAALPQALKKRF